MHRVELKGSIGKGLFSIEGRFLMHRVELKVDLDTTAKPQQQEVPNAPCGVESN